MEGPSGFNRNLSRGAFVLPERERGEIFIFYYSVSKVGSTGVQKTHNSVNGGNIVNDISSICNDSFLDSDEILHPNEVLQKQSVPKFFKSR